MISAREVTGFIIPNEMDEQPRILAEFFCELHAEQQAKFFEHIAAITGEEWSRPACYQWRMMQEHLTPAAKNVINEMKDHTE